MSENTFPPEELDSIHGLIDSFHAKREAEKIHGNLMMAAPEIVQWENEELNLPYAFNDCKNRQTELKSSLRSEEEEKELQAVEMQIQELGHQLAMLGVPIKDGSVVRYQETVD